MIVPCKRAMEGGNFGCAQAGCSQCLEKLICANEGLIHACLQRQMIGGVLYADLEQEGRIALWRAVLKYDPQRGTAFSTYAWVAIRNRVWDAVRQANQSNLWVNGEAPWPSIAVIAERVYQETAIQAALLATVSRLPDRLRAVLVWVYGLDGQPPKTMAALGRQWGLTRERIRQLEYAAWTAVLC